MTIYATPYDPETKQCTGASVDCGFTELRQVTDVLGPAPVGGQRWVGYPDAGVAYSDFIFYSEGTPQ